MHLYYLHIEVLLKTLLSIVLDAFQSCFRHISVLTKKYFSLVLDIFGSWFRHALKGTFIRDGSHFTFITVFTCGEADRSKRGQFISFFLSSPDTSKEELNSVTYMTHYDSVWPSMTHMTHKDSYDSIWLT